MPRPSPSSRFNPPHNIGSGIQIIQLLREWGIVRENPGAGAKPVHVQYPTFSTAVKLHANSPMKMEQTECSETLAFKLQTSGNNPEESIRH
jgi:hypothetical protein